MISFKSCFFLGCALHYLEYIKANSKKFDTNFSSFSSIFCIYSVIGQKKSTVATIYEMAKNKMKRSCNKLLIVAATAAETATQQFIAPYSGCTIGEYYRDLGLSSLLIYDDLSKHAVAYRQLSLLLRRPPGREAYPGDISNFIFLLLY